jgi:hypothetical protein
MLNNFVNFDFSFTKLWGIDACEKRINIPGGHTWRQAKQACGNDKLACVYVFADQLNQKILYLPLENSTTPIAIVCNTVLQSYFSELFFCKQLSLLVK